MYVIHVFSAFRFKHKHSYQYICDILRYIVIMWIMCNLLFYSQSLRTNNQYVSLISCLVYFSVSDIHDKMANSKGTTILILNLRYQSVKIHPPLAVPSRPVIWGYRIGCACSHAEPHHLLSDSSFGLIFDIEPHHPSHSSVIHWMFCNVPIMKPLCSLPTVGVTGRPCNPQWYPGTGISTAKTSSRFAMTWKGTWFVVEHVFQGCVEMIDFLAMICQNEVTIDPAFLWGTQALERNPQRLKCRSGAMNN